MLKAFLILATCVLIGFMIINHSYDVSVTLMGSEYTLSIGFIILITLCLVGCLKFIAMPIEWIKNHQVRSFKKNIQKKEAFLTLALTAVLDKNNETIQAISEQEKKLFIKGSAEQLLLEALFRPTPVVFEKLCHHKSTQLCGLRGLYFDAKNQGDIDKQTQLLEQITNQYPNVLWGLSETLSLQLLQNDWTNAEKTLNELYKNKHITKENFIRLKGTILYGLQKYKEAYQLIPSEPAFAWAYANTVPNKATDILKKSWTQTPTWETYTKYYEFISHEKPEKQIRCIEKFVSNNPSAKLSLLALTDVAMKNHLWGQAKETLEIAIHSYTLTRQMALMMAELERYGWHHEEAALKWEGKAAQLEGPASWICSACNHSFHEWSNKCPVCNECGTLKYH